MTKEQRKEYNIHKDICNKILSDDIKSKGISIKFFKNSFITASVIVAVLLFVIASFAPWVIGVGFGITIGCLFSNLMLDGID